MPESINQPEFRDPALREAILRVRGGHRAAPELRRRIARLLTEPESAAPLRIGPAPTRSPWFRRLAIAAGLALAIGGTSLYLLDRHDRREQEEYVQDNLDLFKTMVVVHNDRSMAVTPLASAAEASKALGRHVPSGDLSGQGWTLAEAATTTMADAKAARFTYTREGGRRLTFLSLPLSVVTGHTDEDDQYAAVIDGHPVVGYVDRGGIHCLVADRGTPLDEAVALRKVLKRS